jgi:hypothetical protein
LIERESGRAAEVAHPLAQGHKIVHKMKHTETSTVFDPYLATRPCRNGYRMEVRGILTGISTPPRRRAS